MNTLLLQPSDILFFRDGRPISGATSGRGAAWPLPSVTSAALHAALHRANLSSQGHAHRQVTGKGIKTLERPRIFGSLSHAGPFPVHIRPDGNRWYFPRPLDLLDNTLKPALSPLIYDGQCYGSSSLPKPLVHSVISSLAPSKDGGGKAWLSGESWEKYIHAKTPDEKADSVNDSEFSDTEYSIGIGMDPSTGVQDGKSIYSAQYLRLREGWKLGIGASTAEKNDSDTRTDLISKLFPMDSTILVGGQQRACRVQLTPQLPPLPLGITSGFKQVRGKWAVKWVLLTPAIFPELPANDSSESHPGGWLPNWIDPRTGKVKLLNGPGKSKSQRMRVKAGTEIDAHLVSAIVEKSLTVSGWALRNESLDRDAGAKASHRAVPAGSVYYFLAETEEAANDLAKALNWHGDDNKPAMIRNRRSTLMGEKGFGLGVCTGWKAFEPQKL